MTRNRKITVGVVGIVLLLLLAYGFWPEATSVTIATAERDSMRVVVEEEGQTQLRQRYVVSAPTTGYLRRVPGTAGDSVAQGEVLARLATLPSTVLDANGYEAAVAQVKAAEAALRQAKRNAEGARAAFTYAKTEYQRIQRLEEQGTASSQQLGAARMEFKKARASYRAAQQAAERARQEMRAARAKLGRETPDPEQLETRVSIRAPVDGRVLRVHQKSAGVVQAGTPLLTVGDPDSLEVSVDVLSADAVRISKGTPVEIVRWGGDRALHGTVRVVSPQGRTEVSALGVKEQRVEVVADLWVPPSVRGRLGTGYRVVVRFVTWAGADVLQVPQSALFRHDDGWAVFAVRNGRAQLQPVRVGHRSGLRAQITEGLSEGARVVTHPGDALSDGTRIAVR